MGKIEAVLSAIFVFLVAAPLPAYAQSTSSDSGDYNPSYQLTVTMLSQVTILESYGFENGVYDSLSDISIGIDDELHETIGNVENEDFFIDTPEEFLTAVYFSPIEITDISAQRIIEEELPQDKEGVLRLCGMWLKKVAEYPENSKNYWDAIELIKQKAEEELNIVVKDNGEPDGIIGYYVEAMRKEIYETPLDLLSSEEKAKARELLLAYFKNPSVENGEKFKDFSRSLRSYDSNKSTALLVFVNTISPEVCNRLVA